MCVPLYIYIDKCIWQVFTYTVGHTSKYQLDRTGADVRWPLTRVWKQNRTCAIVQNRWGFCCCCVLIVVVVVRNRSQCLSSNMERTAVFVCVWICVRACVRLCLPLRLCVCLCVYAFVSALCMLLRVYDLNHETILTISSCFNRRNFINKNWYDFKLDTWLNK